MAKESDVEGKIILGVLTRLDIMNKGIDARKVLLNQEINLNQVKLLLKIEIKKI